MRQNICLAVVMATVLCAVPVTGQIMQSEHFIPIVAHNAGGGEPPTQWVSDLVVMNFYSNTLTVGVMFFPWGADRVTDWDFTFPVTLQLASRETRLIEDVLGTLFGYDRDIKGSLIVSCSHDSFPTNYPDAKMLVSSRTYNTGSAVGTYGQTVPAMDIFANGSAQLSHVAGARQDARYRSNLGIVNLSPQAITVSYRIRNAAGAQLVEGSKMLQVFEGNQWSFASLGLTQEVGPLRVDLWLDPSEVTPDPCAVDWTNSFIAYVSKADGNPQGTGDAEFLPAIPEEFPPADYLCDVCSGD